MSRCRKAEDRRAFANKLRDAPKMNSVSPLAMVRLLASRLARTISPTTQAIGRATGLLITRQARHRRPTSGGANLKTMTTAHPRHTVRARSDRVGFCWTGPRMSPRENRTCRVASF